MDALQLAFDKLEAANSLAEIKKIVRDLVKATDPGGTHTVLYSGWYKIDGKPETALDLANIMANNSDSVRIIDNTATKDFLDSKKIEAKLHALFPEMSLDDIRNQIIYNSDVPGSLWGVASDEFVKGASGHITTITPANLSSGIYHNTEFKAALFNPNVKSINGIPRSELLKSYHQSGNDFTSAQERVDLRSRERFESGTALRRVGDKVIIEKEYFSDMGVTVPKNYGLARIDVDANGKPRLHWSSNQIHKITEAIGKGGGAVELTALAILTAALTKMAKDALEEKGYSIEDFDHNDVIDLIKESNIQLSSEMLAELGQEAAIEASISLAARWIHPLLGVVITAKEFYESLDLLQLSLTQAAAAFPDDKIISETRDQIDTIVELRDNAIKLFGDLADVVLENSDDLIKVIDLLRPKPTIMNAVPQDLNENTHLDDVVYDPQSVVDEKLLESGLDSEQQDQIRDALINWHSQFSDTEKLEYWSGLQDQSVINLIEGIEGLEKTASGIGGTEHTDWFYGDTYSDSLAGGSGADTLAGGAGNDTLSGDTRETSIIDKEDVSPEAWKSITLRAAASLLAEGYSAPSLIKANYSLDDIVDAGATRQQLSSLTEKELKPFEDSIADWSKAKQDAVGIKYKDGKIEVADPASTGSLQKVGSSIGSKIDEAFGGDVLAARTAALVVGGGVGKEVARQIAQNRIVDNGGAVADQLLDTLIDDVADAGLEYVGYLVDQYSVVSDIGSYLGATGFSTVGTNTPLPTHGVALQNLGNQVGSAVGTYLGTRLAIAIFDGNPVGASIGGAIGGSIGAAVLGASISGIAIGTKAGATLGSILPGIGNLVGAFIGAFIGAAFGGLFGSKPKKPTAGTVVELGFRLDQEEFYVSHGYAINGGQRSIANNLAKAGANALNAYLEVVGGRAAEDWDQVSHFGYRASQYVGSGDRRFSNPQDLIDYEVTRVFKQIKIEGGDIYMKRALRGSTAIDIAGMSQDLAIAVQYGAFKDNEADHYCRSDNEISVDFKARKSRHAVVMPSEGKGSEAVPVLKNNDSAQWIFNPEQLAA